MNTTTASCGHPVAAIGAPGSQARKECEERPCVKCQIKMEPCPCCCGGEWEAECCDGSGGCTCRGQRVPMGRCNVCGGSGEIDPRTADRKANINVIRAGGYCFIGSGPTTGYWAGKPAMGRSIQ